MTVVDESPLKPYQFSIKSRGPELARSLALFVEAAPRETAQCNFRYKRGETNHWTEHIFDVRMEETPPISSQFWTPKRFLGRSETACKEKWPTAKDLLRAVKDGSVDYSQIGGYTAKAGGISTSSAR